VSWIPSATSGSNLLIADCADTSDGASKFAVLDYGLCASGSSVSESKYLLICNKMSSTAPSGWWPRTLMGCINGGLILMKPE
jgi:hypothetical protein